MSGYQHEAVLLFTEEWEVEEGRCSLDQLRNQVEQESRLAYLLHCNERVEVTLSNPAIPDPADFPFRARCRRACSGCQLWQL